MAAPLSASIEQLRRPVTAGLTRPLRWRLEQLGRLEEVLKAYSNTVLEALAADLGKPSVEAFYELVAVLHELRLCRQRLRRWLAPQRVGVQHRRAQTLRARTVHRSADRRADRCSLPRRHGAGGAGGWQRRR